MRKFLSLAAVALLGFTPYLSTPPSSGSGSGVAGPETSTDGAVPAFDGTSGQQLHDSAVFLVGVGRSVIQLDGTGIGNVRLGDSAYGPNGLVVLSGDGTAPGHIDGRKLVVAMPEDDAPFQLTGGNGVVTNTASAEPVVGSLPASPTLGMDVCFVVTVAQNLVADAAGSQVIRIGSSASSAGGTATSNTVGSVLCLCYVGTNNWTALSSTGSWTLA